MANPYTTIPQLFALHDRRAMKQLSGDANSADGDSTTLQTILDIEASKVDSYLTGRVALPIASPPAMLTGMVADFAADRLYGRRESRPKGLDARIKANMDWLEAFAKGTVQLPGVDRLNAGPALRISDDLQGRSRFDHIYGTRPTDTSASGRW